MTTNQITSLIHQLYDPTTIHTIDIKIEESPAQQPETLKIIFIPDTDEVIIMTKLGHLISQLDDLIRDDEYGDMVELKMIYSRYEGVDNEELATSILFEFTIDS